LAARSLTMIGGSDDNDLVLEILRREGGFRPPTTGGFPTGLGVGRGAAGSARSSRKSRVASRSGESSSGLAVTLPGRIFHQALLGSGQDSGA